VTYIIISTFNQNHKNHSTVFVALGNKVTNLVSKHHLEVPTVALVSELLSRMGRGSISGQEEPL
jgi:hypothetical protein